MKMPPLAAPTKIDHAAADRCACARRRFVHPDSGAPPEFARPTDTETFGEDLVNGCGNHDCSQLAGDSIGNSSGLEQLRMIRAIAHSARDLQNRRLSTIFSTPDPAGCGQQASGRGAHHARGDGHLRRRWCHAQEQALLQRARGVAAGGTGLPGSIRAERSRAVASAKVGGNGLCQPCLRHPWQWSAVQAARRSGRPAETALR